TRQVLGRGVSSFRLLAQRAQRDHIEITPESPTEALRSETALRADRGRIDRYHLAARPGHRNATPHRRRWPLPAGRALASQKLMEETPELVDVARGSSALTGELFRAGVLRRHQPLGAAGDRAARVRLSAE